MVLNGSYSKENEDFFVIIKRIKEARKMTQQFRALAAFTEDKGLSSVNNSPPSTWKSSLR